MPLLEHKINSSCAFYAKCYMGALLIVAGELHLSLLSCNQHEPYPLHVLIAVKKKADDDSQPVWFCGESAGQGVHGHPAMKLILCLV